jgi:hypothetical protein
MPCEGNTGRGSAPALALVDMDDGRGSAFERDPAAERDLLAQAADDLDRAITDLPAGSPWRPWLAKVSRVLRAATGLASVRLAEGGR